PVVIIVTGVAFGLFHVSIYRFFGTTTLGFVMAALVLYTRSIWPAVIFHAFNNGMALSVSDVFTDPDGSLPLWAAALGLGGLVLGGLLIWRGSTRQQPDPANQNRPIDS